MGPTACITLPSRRLARITPVAAALLAVTACGGGSSEPSTSSPPPTYSIGGTVSGLDADESLALHLSGGDDLTVSANGAFTFATKVIGGGGYAVSVRVQPQGKSCAVADGAGTATANVTNVAVACSGPTTAGPYTVGGTVSGLVGQGLTLAIYNPANTAHHTVLMGVLAISSNGLYRTARIPDGYGVLVQNQPHSPAQRCVVRHPWGSLLMGAMPDDVTDVDVICGEFSYVISTAANTISTFTVDAHSGAIISAGPPVSAGSSPAAIAMTRDKQYLYVGNGASNDVSEFAVNPGTGTLKATLGAPVAASTNPRALARYTAVDVGYGPPLITDYLYVANAGSNDLSVFRVDDRTGVLTPLSPASYPTEAGPSALVIDSGPFLYAANSGGSNSIAAFTIDTRSGGLTSVAHGS